MIWKYLCPSVGSVLAAGMVGQYFGSEEPMTGAAFFAAMLITLAMLAQAIVELSDNGGEQA
jgi:hypothetical protein